MLNRASRLLLTGSLLAVAVSGLSACRTSPNVAAYVGDEQVTVDELDDAVAQRLDEPGIAAYAETQPEEFSGRVLTLLVQEEVYSAAADRYGLRIGDDTVRSRIDELLGDDDPDAVYEQLAQEGISREDVFQNVRQQLVRLGIAEAEGQAEALSEASLRARYAEVREGLVQTSFGYITVPDQATADAVLAQLTAAPAGYPALAAQFPGTYTLPDLEARAADEIPPVLAQGIEAAAPDTGFTTPVAEAGGVVVTFVEGPVYPPFEEIRSDLEREAGAEVESVGAGVVEDVRDDLGVTVNPRFGVLEEGQLVPSGAGVVDILGGDDGAAATE